MSSTTVITLKLIPLILISFVSLIGNILLVRSAARKGYRKTGTNIVILSQTIADLGTTCFVIPFAMIAVYKDEWILGEALCRLDGFCNLFFTFATLYNLSFLAYDRFLVIVHKNHRTLTCEQAVKGITAVWCIAFALSFPWMDMASEKTRTVFARGFYVCNLRYGHPFGALEIFGLVLLLVMGAAIPTAIILFSFYRILVVYKDHRLRTTPVTLSSVAKFALEQYCRSAYTSLLMIGTTMLFVFPSCFSLFIEGIQVTSIPHSFATASKWIMWCHCAAKPMIYFCRNQNGRKIIARYFRACLPEAADSLYSVPSGASSQASVIGSELEARSQSNIRAIISKEEMARRKDLGLPVPIDAWTERQFLDVCAV
jgi:hypothetical protein